MNEIKRYASAVSRLNSFSQSPTFIVDTIINPVAGCFRRKKALQRIIGDIERRLQTLQTRHNKKKIEIDNVHITEYAGHERKIVENILEQEQKRTYDAERLIVAAGGDGMSNHVCSTLLFADQRVLRRIKVLRFPLGTGNDSADAKTFADAYDLILGNQSTKRISAVEIVTGKPTERSMVHAFNVVSLGLDAYITLLTNYFKRLVPGGTYRIMVDFGTLFYGAKYHPGEFDIAMWQGNHPLTRTRQKITMLVMGASGMRTYGGRIPVLPSQENVCLVDEMGVVDQLRNKRVFYQGKHDLLPQVGFYSADNVVIDYTGGRIPMQIDGEDYELTETHFPISMKTIQTPIRVVTQTQ